MTNPSKKKGTRAESAVVKFLAERGIESHRKALSGSNDCGDIEIPRPLGTIILEVKSGKQTSNYNRGQLKDWIYQAGVEAINNADINTTGYLVVVKYNKRLQDADVWYQGMMYGEVVRLHWYLDEFVDFLLRNNEGGRE